MRMGTWYWLNVGTPELWPEDFARIREAGCHYVAMGYGCDQTELARRTDQTRRALDAAAEAGLGAYLLFWSVGIMGIEANPDFVPVQADGQAARRRCNVFHPGWRRERLLPYVTAVAETYGNHPALLGFYVDDAFGCYGDYLYGYSRHERAAFRDWLKERYRSVGHLNGVWGTGHRDWEDIDLPRGVMPNVAAWMDFTAARGQWLDEWARELTGAMRTAAPRARLVLGESAGGVLRAPAGCGADWPALAAHFDTFMIYLTYDFEQLKPDDWRAVVRRTVETGRRIAASRELIVCSWVTHPERFTPMPREVLEATVAEAAEGGADAFEYYAWRTADWRHLPPPPYVNLPNWPVYLADQGELREAVSQINHRLCGNRPGTGA
ncbi:MAG: beta-galactosidase [Planctomycetota bacterium]